MVIFIATEVSIGLACENLREMLKILYSIKNVFGNSILIVVPLPGLLLTSIVPC
ncbi:hypothetical protein KP78_17090 [Jeotgalibacillus soli]|uniref:Uncharacterized protein n=1 Tax=Jeotgalibacillus soli TaxID=889306 RepID=A0A0C2VHB0_9BACL|nr:hypothetical protein KP78_17090 [Jeotgalibacillus soli]